MLKCFEALIETSGEWIYIYTGVETIDDPFEKNVITTYNNALTVKAIVTDVAFTKIKWAMPGVLTTRAKQIIIDKRYRSLLEASQKIEIKNDDKIMESYSGWRENGKLMYIIEGNTIRAYIYSKHT